MLMTYRYFPAEEIISPSPLITSPFRALGRDFRFAGDRRAGIRGSRPSTGTLFFDFAGQSLIQRRRSDCRLAITNPSMTSSGPSV